MAAEFRKILQLACQAGYEPYLETSGALREVRIAIDPGQAVHVHCKSAQAFILHHPKPNLVMHVQVVLLGSCLYEWPIKPVSIVCHIDCGLHLNIQPSPSAYKHYSIK